MGFVLAATFAVARPAVADPLEQSPSVAVLPRADFHLEAQKLFSSDRRFRWLLEIGFDTDLLDYRTGRIRLRGDYEAVEGRERRRFDLNQGTYFFELSGSWRAHNVEVVVFEQHVSRHLVDRENPPAISWNEIGARVEHAGHSPFRVEFEVGRPWDLAFVDYAWRSRLHVAYERASSDRTTLFASGTGHLIDGTDPARQKGSGGRIEAGVRMRGEAAALEVFAAYERRLDAFPTERSRVRWISVGFRLVTK